MDQRKIMRTLTRWKLQQDQHTLVVGGYSMAPVINPGDFIHVEEGAICRVGDVAVVISEDARLLVHRVVRKQEGILYTKGDNAVATERVTPDYCLGRVSRITNRNGKNRLLAPGYREGKLLAALSRGMNRVWLRHQNYKEAIGCSYRRWMLRLVPDEDKAFAKAIETDLFRLATMLVEGALPDRHTPYTNNFTREHVKTMVQHQFLTLGYPYVIGCAGRWTKMLMILKAQKRVETKNLMEQCIRVSARLEEAGIPYAVIKGIPLSYSAYGNGFARDSTDVDFLILPEDAQRAHDLLYEMGYQNHDSARRCFFQSPTPPVYYPTHFYPYVIPEIGNGVELHTAQCVEEKYTGELLARRERLSVEGALLWVLDPVDAFLCLLLSVGADDNGSATISYDEEPSMFLRPKLRNYVDILCFYQRQREFLSEQEILDRLERYACTFFVFLALSNAAELFHVDWFDSLLSAMAKGVRGMKGRNRLRLATPMARCLFDPLQMKTNGKLIYQQHKDFYFRDLRVWHYGPHNPAMSQVWDLLPEEERVLTLSGAGEEMEWQVLVHRTDKRVSVSLSIPSSWLSRSGHVVALCLLHPEGKKACREFRWLFWHTPEGYRQGFYRIRDHCSVWELVQRESAEGRFGGRFCPSMEADSRVIFPPVDLPKVPKNGQKCEFRTFYGSAILSSESQRDYVKFCEKEFDQSVRIR